MLARFSYDHLFNLKPENWRGIVFAVLLYAVIMATTYLLFPPNPDKITIPMDLIMTFRVAVSFTIGIFWDLIGITLGSFWDKFKPNESNEISTI